MNQKPIEVALDPRAFARLSAHALRSKSNDPVQLTQLGTGLLFFRCAGDWLHLGQFPGHVEMSFPNDGSFDVNGLQNGLRFMERTLRRDRRITLQVIEFCNGLTADEQLIAQPVLPIRQQQLSFAANPSWTALLETAMAASSTRINDSVPISTLADGVFAELTDVHIRFSSRANRRGKRGRAQEVLFQAPRHNLTQEHLLHDVLTWIEAFPHNWKDQQRVAYFLSSPFKIRQPRPNGAAH